MNPNSTSRRSHQEKFTIVILTYKRVDELMKILVHLNGLPKLDKIVIVWNSPDFPTRDLKWPENLSVPMHVSQVRT
jgi:alpha-1,4-N-acetylglucosaminyltransferase EXTL3